MAVNFTGLWGLTREMNNLVTSLSLIGAVKAPYCLSVCMGQTSELCGKEEKKSLSGLPCFYCFARAAGRKTTSSGLNLVAMLLGL